MALIFSAYALLIVIASLAGGWVPMMVRLTHRRMQFATSLIAGFMLGVALLHLLAHSLHAIEPMPAMLAALCGLLAMFFLERFFHSHQHLAPGEQDMPPVTADPEPIHTHEHCEHDHADPIDHHHGHSHEHARLSWIGVSIGLVIHSLIGGAALAAAMAAEAGALHGSTAPASSPLDSLPGIAVFLVIVLHRPFDAMTLLTLLRTAGWSGRGAHAVNILFALMVPAGGLLFFGFLGGVDLERSVLVGYALAAAAGVFLCVSLADLLPEVHFHRHDRLGLSVAVLLGLSLAWGIAYAESRTRAHEHGHTESDPGTTAPAGATPDPHDQHDHAGHDH